LTESAPERYLRLGLQLGHHVEGLVDAYFGPPELAAAVDAEALLHPRAFVAAAEALLDELEDGWLRDQVVGLRTYAGALAGESVSYADEVQGCYGVRPTYTDERCSRRPVRRRGRHLHGGADSSTDREDLGRARQRALGSLAPVLLSGSARAPRSRRGR
jgi:hypothetical protein